MPPAVIDLTDERNDERRRQTLRNGEDEHYGPVAGPSAPRRRPATAIDLTDDDVEFVAEHRIHFPPRPYGTGNDSGARDVNQHARPASRQRAQLHALANPHRGESTAGIFSRDAGRRPGAVIHDDDLQDYPYGRNAQGPAAEGLAARLAGLADGIAAVRGRNGAAGPRPPPPGRAAGRRPQYQGLIHDPRNYEWLREGGDELVDAQPPGWLNYGLDILHHIGGIFRGGHPAPVVNRPPPNEEAKRRKRKYSVKQSHPQYTKKQVGFSRDIIPPPEIEEEEEPAQQSTSEVTMSALGKRKLEEASDTENPAAPKEARRELDVHTGDLTESDGAGKPDEDFDVPALDLQADAAVKAAPEPEPPKKMRKILAPVCASCLEPFFLNQIFRHRPYVLLCGHVSCFKCLSAAKTRCEEWSKTKKAGGWTGTPVEAFEEIEPKLPDPTSTGKGKGKATKRAPKKRNTANHTAARGGRGGRTAVASRSRYGRPTRSMNMAEDFDEEGLDEDPTFRPSDDEGAVEAPEAQPQEEDNDAGGDDEMGDEIRQPANKPVTGKKKGVAKGKKAEKPIKEVEVDPNWLSCPIIGCPGRRTDLLAALGSAVGAWEMFV